MPMDASVEHASGIDENAWPSLHVEDDLVIVADVEPSTFSFNVAVNELRKLYSEDTSMSTPSS